MNKILRKVPELLAPAGNFDKLKVAVKYGANAVYLAGQKYGLRSAADNFTYEELPLAVKFAHDHGAKAYLTLNSFVFDEDLEGIKNLVIYAKECGIDAAIVSDLGVGQILHQVGGIPLHVSTQASINNAYAAKAWKRLGATRIILGREVTIEEAGLIKKETGLEIEMFIHGSMCMAYSGHCVISNYTQGRDSNRGGCAHSCRFEYELGNNVKTHFMSSKDLKGLEYLEKMIEAGIDSIKVEGRMKSELYAAVTSKVYASALRMYATKSHLDSQDIFMLANELQKVPHRAYSEASLITPADETSVFDERDGVTSGYNLAAQVLINEPEVGMILEVRQAFNTGDTLEIVPFVGNSVLQKVDCLNDIQGNMIQRTKPSSLVKLPFVAGVEALNLVRVAP